MWGEGQGAELPALPPRPPPNPRKLTGEGGAIWPRLPRSEKLKGLGEGVWGRIVRGPAALSPFPQKS